MFPFNNKQKLLFIYLFFPSLSHARYRTMNVEYHNSKRKRYGEFKPHREDHPCVPVKQSKQKVNKGEQITLFFFGLKENKLLVSLIFVELK